MTPPITAATHSPAPFTIGIDAAAYELPGERQDLHDWAQQHKLPAERFDMIRNAGCRYFHVAPDIDEVELAKRAVARLQDEQGFKGSDIGAVIHVHTGLFSVPPAPRSLPLEVATAFGINPVWAGSIAQLNCSSISVAIQMAQALMKVHSQLHSVLIVSSDRVFIERYRVLQASILSDGAGCLLVTRNSRRNRVGATAVRNYGSWYLGSVTNNAVKQAMFNLEWHYTRKVMMEAVADCGVALRDFTCILPYNSNHSGWNAFCNAMAIPATTLYTDNILNKGHSFGSDLAINLADRGLSKVDAGAHLMNITESDNGSFSALTLHPVN
ncbi:MULTISPECIES: beta-ketoacyl-[acyl-carrier-protein] synthase family protein [Pseudomonas]|uniref:3-oxoacyl-ACP synthase n=1 Tax=Pseudomonas helleri TaxID=1608996 RepID=A0A6L5I095_9PSED|nr:3-oxoacyl-ACP synthase [Pseudomonas helleri]MQU08963.1 3-oxoacyl-ACP synthase [Pseudomonas helleri]